MSEANQLMSQKKTGLLRRFAPRNAGNIKEESHP